MQDLEMLKTISWEAVIIDQCQGSAMSMHLPQFKVLVADMRILLFHQLEDRCDRRFNHRDVLSLLDPKYDEANNNDMPDTDYNIGLTEFKERFKHFVAYEGMSKSKFIEYWVPVKLSVEQIEQYCFSLFSNSAWLRSYLKSESLSSLHDILVSIRKCCDHPYLEDRSLRNKVIEGTPVDQHLDAEIKLSGKLELLDKILQEIKQQGLRVLILFRSLGGGSEVISIGDILDDFIHQKFGEESYTHIRGNMGSTKKRATLNKFNNKGSEQFAFLIETRVCVPNLKLSRIDTIILFNSDWDPANDLKFLAKIAIYSQSEHINVFRLYSCFTVEEKVLILAKQGLAIDGNTKNIKQAACHELLAWGACDLLSMHDNFHGQSSSSSKESSEVHALDHVFAELLGLISGNCEKNGDYNNSCSKILKVEQNGGTYPREISLIGEREMHLMDDSSFVRRLTENEAPEVFWTNLLHGRVPKWKHMPKRIRRARLEDASIGVPQVSEKKARKEANKVDLIPGVVLKKKRKSRLQGKIDKPGKSHLSAGNKHKLRRLVRNPGPQCGKEATSWVQSEDVDSSGHHVSDSTDLQPEDLLPADSSVHQSTGDLPHQQHTRMGAVHPLQMEMERIQNEREETMKQHEDLKLLLMRECEKELDAIKKKYDLVLQIAETESVRKQTDLDMFYDKVQANKLLAEAMIQLQNIADAPWTREMTTDEQLVATPSQHAALPVVTHSTTVEMTSGSTILQTESSVNPLTSGSRITPNFQPVNLMHVSSTSIPSHIPSLSCAANFGLGCEPRKPAPHLRHSRPLPTLNSMNSSVLSPGESSNSLCEGHEFSLLDDWI